MTNDASTSKTDRKFLTKLCAVDGDNKKISSKDTASVLKILI